MQHDATDHITAPPLSSKQERAIDLLLAGETTSQVAQTVSVDRSTIHRWHSQPEFAASLNRRRLALREAYEFRLQCLQERAIEALEGEIEQGNGRVALAVLKGTGLLSGDPMPIGPTNPDAVRRVQATKENDDRLTDLINSMSP